jgi:hypothetical protein
VEHSQHSVACLVIERCADHSHRRSYEARPRDIQHHRPRECLEIYDLSVLGFVRDDPTPRLLEYLRHEYVVIDSRQSPAKSQPKIAKHTLNAGVERAAIAIKKRVLIRRSHGDTTVRWQRACGVARRAIIRVPPQIDARLR